MNNKEWDGEGLRPMETENGSLTEEQWLQLKPIAQNNRQWDGKGLPPVGAKCLYLNQKVFFVGVDVDGFAVLQWGGETKYTQVDYIVENFRPIKPELSERDKFSKQLSEDTGFAVHEDDAGEVYDAGYRKVTKLTDVQRQEIYNMPHTANIRMVVDAVEKAIIGDPDMTTPQKTSKGSDVPVRDRAIEEMGVALCSWKNGDPKYNKEHLAALYDAGYRKVLGEK